MMPKNIHTARLGRFATAFTYMQYGILLAMSGCGPRDDESVLPPEIHRDEVRFGLNFEERMAIPAQLSRLRGEAQKRADEIYDPFRSKEDAIRNEEYYAQLYQSAVNDVLADTKLTKEQLAEIIKEYQVSLGGNLR